MADKIERREHPRSELIWPVTVLADHGTIEGETVNIASEGIFICCEEPLRLNGVFKISILPPNHQAIGVTGKVIWSDLYGIDEGNTTYGMGICLVEISDKDRHFLNDIVSDQLPKKENKEDR